MTNKMTLKQAVALASQPEALATQTIETLEVVVETITASQDKRAHKKLDIVKAVLKQLKSQPGANTDKIEQIENSTKAPVKKVIKPSVKAEKVAEQKAPKVEPVDYNKMNVADLKAELTKRKVEFKEKSPKPVLVKLLVADDNKAEPKAQQKAVTKTAPKTQPKAEPKAEPKTEASPFPNEHEGHIKVSLKDLPKVIMEQPYEVHALIMEKGQKKPTDFLVTYANNSVVVLVDLSNDVNSVIALEVADHFHGEKVSLDNVLCPYAFYAPTEA